MPTPQKEAIVAELREALENSAGLYLLDFSGIRVNQVNALRGQILEAGGRVFVAKNRLLKLAFAGTAAEGLADVLKGPTAVMFCAADPITPGRAVLDFAKTLTNEAQRWEIKAAFVDGVVYDTNRARALASMPPMDEIKGSVVGSIAGPLNALVGTLNGAVSELVYTLQAVADKRQEQAA